MKKYQALIVDDESGNRALLRQMLSKHCPQIGAIDEARSVAEAENRLRDQKVDVVFLDVEMPGENGFDLLKKLDQIDFKIIFVTAYDAYALRAIKYSALDYLLKPLNQSELVDAVNKLETSFTQIKQIDLLNYNLQSGINKRVALTTQAEVLFVEVSHIIRLQAEANYTKIYLTEEAPILLSGNIGHYEKLLNDQRFYRSHQSHLVNLDHVKKYVKSEGGYFVMNKGSQVPISRLKREEVKYLFMK